MEHGTFCNFGYPIFNNSNSTGHWVPIYSNQKD